MPTDHPDGTRAIVISRAEIQTPIDIQHQTTNVDTDFKAQSVGVYAQPEWAAKEGDDKNFEVYGSNLGWNDTVEEEYQVPAGKTLYITGCSFRISPYTDTDFDHFFYAAFYLQDRASSGVSVDAIVQLGGVGGSGLTFPKPIPFAAGRYFAVGAVSKTNLPSDIYCYAWGYEV